MTALEAAVGIAFVAVLTAACGSSGPSSADAASSAATPPTRFVGRSQCIGAVPRVLDRMDGANADAVEQLQGRFDGEPGFLAVVHDGTKAVVIVEPGRPQEWQSRLAPLGIVVAVSCVDPAVLASVHAAISRLRPEQGRIISAGYDGLDDAITVLGVKPDELLRAIEDVAHGSGPAVLAAIANRTLRIDPSSPVITR